MLLVEQIAQLGRYIHFAARSLAAAFLAIGRPRDLLQQLYQVHVGALPVSLVGGLALGCIIWMHLHGVLIRFGPGNVQLLPQALALAVVLELAPMGAGLIVAGRSGASLGAELGSMRLTEQIDALEVMGINSASYLVLPKVVASLLMYPLLVIIAAVSSLVGGYLVGTITGVITPTDYIYGIRFTFNDYSITIALMKAVVFAFLISTISSFKGYFTQGGALEVGIASTAAVTTSVIAVLLSDYFLVQILLKNA